MQPQLALTYDSRKGDGLAGVGWSLAGPSSITRCAKSNQVDHFVEPVRFDDTDPLCLDGERLVLVSGVAAQQNAEYRTFRNRFEKVVIIDHDVSGPTGFIVYERGGLIRRYGTQPISRIEGVAVGYAPFGPGRTDISTTTQSARYSWLLESLADRSGNSMFYVYGPGPASGANSSGLERVLIAINYASISNALVQLPALRSIQFSYDLRPDVRSEFVSGLSLVHRARLTVITVNGPVFSRLQSSTLRTYRLGYGISDTGRSLLTSVQDCDGATSVATCHTPSVFNYSALDPGFTEIKTEVNDVLTAPGVRSDLAGRIQIVDINGDGRDDILYVSAEHPNEYTFRLATVGPNGVPGFGPPHYTGLLTTWRRDRPQPLDFNADGRSDLFNFDDANQSSDRCGPSAGYLLSLATVPNGGSAALAPPKVLGFAPALNGVAASSPLFAYAADLDGDRLADFWLAPYDAPACESGSIAWSYRRHSTVGMLGDLNSLMAPIQWGPALPAEPPRLLDVDSDGATEVLVRDMPGTQFGVVTSGDEQSDWYTALYLARGASHAESYSKSTTLTATETYTFLDMNGDGLVDAIAPNSPSLADRIVVNSGSGFTPPYNSSALSPYPVNDALVGARLYRVMDYDFDGRQDLLVRMPTQSQHDQFVLLRSNGTDFAAPLSLPFTSVPFTPDAGNVFEVLDVNGDGLDDVVMYDVGTRQSPGSLKLYVRKGGKPDLLSKVTDGLGSSVTIFYAPTSIVPLYTPSSSGCAYPQQCQRSKMWVVSAHEADNGIGGQSHYSYYYGDGRINALTQTFVGFTSVKRIQAENSVEYIRQYSLDPAPASSPEWGLDPLSGLPVSEVTRTPMARGVWHVTDRATEYAVQWDASGHSYFPYAASVIKQESVVDSSGVSHLLRSATIRHVVDTYDNVVAAATVWGDTEIEEVDTDYLNDENNWIIGRPVLAISRDTAPGGSVSIRHTGYVYDGLGLLQQVVTEPGTRSSSGWDPLPPQADGVSTEYASINRDVFGNVASVTQDRLSTPTPTARTTKIAYDTAEAAFLVQWTNALGQVSTYVNQQGTGQALEVTDPNGVATTFQYDGFGRLIHQARAGTPSLSMDFEWVTPTPGVYLIKTTSSTGAIKSEVHDSLDRTIETRSMDRNDGKEVRKTSVYDLLGRVSLASDAYFTGETARWTKLSYDPLNRMILQINPDGGSSKMDFLDSHPSPQDSVEDLRSVTGTDPLGHVHTLFADQHSRLVKSIEHDGTSDYATAYSFGPFDELTQVIGPSVTSLAFSYDRLGRTIGSQGTERAVRTYRFDIFGDLASESVGTHTTKYVRDLLGRVVKSSGDDGDTLVQWDAAPSGIGLISSSVSSFSIRTDYAYSQSGLIAKKRTSYKTPSGAPDYLELAYSYDSAGRVTQMHYSASAGTPDLAVDYSYGGHGQLIELADSAKNPIWHFVDSDATGIFRTEKLGPTVTTQWFESPTLAGHVRAIRSSEPGKVVQELRYEMDLNGNVTQRQDTTTNSAETFAYDGLDRLQAWTLKAPKLSRDMTYAYDGSTTLRTETLVPPSANADRFFDGGLHAITKSNDGGYQYDDEWRQSAAPGRATSYTEAGLPKSIHTGGQQLALSYDASEARVLEEYTPTRWAASMDRKIRESRDEQKEERRFTVEVAGQPIAEFVWQRSNTGVWAKQSYFLHQDYLGSITAVTDEKGKLVDRFAYEPFGARLVLNGAPATPASGVTLGFTAQLHLDDFDLIDMRGRFYDPYLRRFMSPDREIGDVSSAGAFDPYAYVRNNPTSRVDPSGFDEDDEIEKPDDGFRPVEANESSGACNGGCTLEGDEYVPPTPSPPNPSGGSADQGANDGGADASATVKEDAVAAPPGEAASRGANPPSNDDGLGARSTSAAGDNGASAKSSAADLKQWQQEHSGDRGLAIGYALYGISYANTVWTRGSNNPFMSTPYIEQNKGKIIALDAGLYFGGLATVALTTAGVEAGASVVSKNVSVQGPSPGLAYANGRIVGLVFRGTGFGIRLDFHPLPGSPEPVLHINIGFSGRGEGFHIPIFDPKWLIK